MNEERKKCGLYIRVNFLRPNPVGSVSPLAWQDFEGLNKALVQQGITRSWQESAQCSEWPFSLPLPRSHPCSHGRLLSCVTTLFAHRNRCRAPVGLETGAGCTKAVRCIKREAVAIGTKVLDTAGNPSRSPRCRVLTVENLSPGN